MSYSGIHNPDSIDFTICSDDAFRFVLFEKTPLINAHASALQQKLNNYLKMAESGYQERYAEASSRERCILLDLHAQPSNFIMEILKQYAPRCAARGISFEVAVNGDIVIPRKANTLPATSASPRRPQRQPVSKGKQVRTRSLYL